jgi:dihydrofolate reductase
MPDNRKSKNPPSRRVVANIVLSLDGRVNGPGGEYDMSWIVPHAISDTSRDHVAQVTSPATTVLLGRKNYEGFAGYWPPVADDESADRRDRAFSRWLTEVEKIVVSTTLGETSWANATATSRPPSEVVADLRQQPGGDIIVLASSSVIRNLLEADEVDRLSVMLCPETAGGGTRLFDDDVRQRGEWELVGHEVTETGAIWLLYDRKR